MEESHGDDVPSLFICPISMAMMKDPVTISTGITFERESIRKWFISYKKTNCPVTMQPLSDFSLTPNSNLQRLIQSWQSDKASKSNPASQKPSMEEVMALALRVSVFLEELEQPHLQVKSLRAIRSLLVKVNDVESVRSRVCLKDDDVFHRVSTLVCDETETSLQDLSPEVDDHEAATVLDEGLPVLCLLKPSKQAMDLSLQYRNGLFLDSLCLIISSYPRLEAKIGAVLLLKSVLKSTSRTFKSDLSIDFFESLTEILKDQNSNQGSLAVLQILLALLSHGRNTENATKSGLVSVLVELMAEDPKKRRLCEIMLVVLEKLCRKPEGREAFVSHPMGIATVLSKLSMISHLGNDKAVSMFTWVFRFCKRTDVLSQFMEVGGASKLNTILNGGCSTQTKHRVREILRFYLREWNRSPCFPPGFKDARTIEN